MRSYQILTIIGALFVIYDLFFVTRQISLSVLFVNVFGEIIVLSVVMLYSIGNFGLLRLRHPEMALFVMAAITALRYKN